MATWAQQRQSMIVVVIIVVLLALIIPFVLALSPKPTCFDEKKNQDEIQIDCGGICQKVCSIQAAPLAVLWERPFPVAEGVYSAVAYVSNINPTFVARNVPYNFKFYDEKNILIVEHRGVIDIPAKSDFPVFEGGIGVGKAKVKSVFFEFTETPNWEKSAGNYPKIQVGAPALTLEPTPKVEVDIKNQSYTVTKNLSVVVIVYDTNGNALGASETFVDVLGKNQSTGLVFTWLSSFGVPISRVEIYPRAVY